MNEHLMYLADSTKTDWETALRTADEQQRQPVDEIRHLSYRQKIDALYTAVDYFCDSLATANVLAKQIARIFLPFPEGQGSG